MTKVTNPVFSQKAMATRKEVFTNAVALLAVEGFTFVGQTKEGVVFEELATGAFVVVKSVAKKEEFDFAEAEAELLEAVEAREAKAKAAAEKKAKAESKKAKTEE